MDRSSIRFGIIEDQCLTRELLTTLLDEPEGYRVTGVFCCVKDALVRFGSDLPDDALVDIGLPGMSGIQGIRILREPLARLLESIQELVNGGAPMSPHVARTVLRVLRDFRAPRQTDCELTAHELRLLKLLVEGHTYKTAAAELRVSTHTVSFHLRHVYEKLHVHSKSEAVGKAMRDGLVC